MTGEGVGEHGPELWRAQPAGHIWVAPDLMGRPATLYVDRIWNLIRDADQPWRRPNRSPFDWPHRTLGLTGGTRSYYVPPDGKGGPTDWNELVAPRLTRLMRRARRLRANLPDAWHVLHHGLPEEDW